jgi:hypothetical protein
LLLSTPVSGRQIVSGQWRALLRMFGLPVAMLLGVHVAGSGLSQLGFQRLATQVSTATSSAVTNQSGKWTNQTFSLSTTVVVPAKVRTNAAPTPRGFQIWPPGRNPASLRATLQQAVMAVAAATAAGLSTSANLIALCWFGMWMGMTSRSANLATLKSILFVQVIPWFVITFAASMLILGLASRLATRSGSTGPGAFFSWWPLLSTLLAAAVALAKDIGFIVWSRNKLHSSLREQATRSPADSGFAPPRLVPATPPAPPIIQAPR